MRFLLNALIVPTVTTVLGISAFAHGDVTGIVKERMDSMVTLAKTLKSIAPMIKGDVEYDPQTIRDAAIVIQNHAGEHLTNKFPEGSNPMASEVAPAVWDDPEGFKMIADQLSLYAQALEQAADNGPTGAISEISEDIPETLLELSAMPTGILFQKIGKTCSACHDDYRIKK
jgi:cytochrome c556